MRDLWKELFVAAEMIHATVASRMHRPSRELAGTIKNGPDVGRYFAQLFLSVWCAIAFRRDEMFRNRLARKPITFAFVLELIGLPKYLSNSLGRVAAGNGDTVLIQLCKYFGSSQGASGCLEDDLHMRPHSRG